MIDIEKLQAQIVERLKPLEPEKVILFGSHATDSANEESDVDLYIVTKDEFIPQSYSEKREIVRSVSRHILDIRQQVGIDLLVHTKKMSEKFFEMGSSFAREMTEKGKVLYAR